MAADFQALFGNLAWSAASWRSYAAFARSLRNPEQAQMDVLRKYLRRNEQNAFGKEHRFAKIGSYADFQDAVPIRRYSELQPWFEESVRVTHYVTTTGTTSEKRIPCTAELQREFSDTVSAWIFDLYRQKPTLLAGRAFWSITPPKVQDAGLKEDSEYLGGSRKRLIDRIMAVPAAVGHAGSMEAFWYATALTLLRRRDLRLISIWHPSFLAILLKVVAERWNELMDDLRSGGCQYLEAFPPQYRDQLVSRPQAALESNDACILWPDLALVSCWADGAARPAARELQKILPGIEVQPKGLLATEAFVSIPFRGRHPVAVNTHFFEFEDYRGNVVPVHLLEEDREYEVIVTTGGGLWRYRLGDRVRVTGFLERTPSIEFVCRVGNVSDLFGEKLSEDFVGACLREVCGDYVFGLLAPDRTGETVHYTLFLEGDVRAEGESRLDALLCRNPHYSYCRKLGQLGPSRVFRIADGHRRFVERMQKEGMRLGDIKPGVLSRMTGWAEWFGCPLREASPLL